MKTCDCYREQKVRVENSPSVKMLQLIMTGKSSDESEVVYGKCWGTAEMETCHCHGDRTQCDFYPEVREKAIKERKKDKIEKKVSPAKALAEGKTEDEIIAMIEEKVVGVKDPKKAARAIYKLFFKED